MYLTDDKGKWKVEGNIKLLIEPSESYLQQLEQERLEWESQPQPPTLEEQLTEKDKQIQLLKEQQLRTDADLAAFMDFILSGGM